MKKKKSLLIIITFFFLMFYNNLLIAQDFTYKGDNVTDYLENPSNIISPENIDIKSTSKEELNPTFAFYFNMFYGTGDLKVSKIIDKKTIYSDSYYCPRNSNHFINSIFENCGKCGSKLKFRPRIEYQFFKKSQNSKGKNFNEYEIEYDFIPKKNIFVAAIKYSKENFTQSYDIANYKTTITYVAFNPYLGPLTIEVLKDYNNKLYSFDNNAFSRKLETFKDSINRLKLNKIDEILNSKIKKKEKKSLIESIESNHLSENKYLQIKLENEYLLKMNLYKLFGWNFVVELNESKSKQFVNNSYIILDDGNYSFSIEGENIKYNPDYIYGLNENYISRKYGIKNKEDRYPLEFDNIYNMTNENTTNKYLLGSTFKVKTSKYIKRIKTSDNQFIEVEKQSPELSDLSRNIISDAIGQESAFFIDEFHYQLFILSRYGHPIFKVPGGYYKNIKKLGENIFEVTQVSSNSKIRLNLSNDANSISEMIKLVR